MRTHESKKSKHKASKEVKTRRLKVQPKIIHNVWTTSCFPEIKLSGKWLQDHGFEAGSEVVVSVERRRLVITV